MAKREKEAGALDSFDFGAFEQEAIKQLKAGKSLSGREVIRMRFCGLGGVTNIFKSICFSP